ncbi:MAG TPA: NAD(P)/FAD-dependent oxidoreductase [Candidatus Thalassarchaeaceae archaeon]|nr:MAG TPA: NAD(P)/FAD-dependent oxidoreductase [Candidatus Poseidoniales archaeon]HII33516.1 NAD(P)/FAD-dependent oxidoreductase [Candidatus Thalassarchaeaceae archaeon]
MSVQSRLDEYYDVVIIGAGPVGGYLGWSMRKLGHSVLIIEEHSEIGRPFQCAGLVNPGAMERVPMEDTVLTPIWGARINSPNGTTVDIGSPERVRTWSVCRKKFDEGVVRLAVESGANIILNSKPTNIVIEDNFAELSVDVNGTIMQVRCALVCGCDGAHSWVRREMKMGRPKEMMIGYQVEVTGYNGSEGQLDMFTGNDIAPGFFAWAIPSGETTRIGMWSRADLLSGKSCEMLVDNLMNSSIWKSRFEHCNIIGRFGGPVPSGLLKYPLGERVALFGDASGACKPTTGGGIGTGFDQVDLLAPKLSAYMNNDTLGKEKMKALVKNLEPLRKKLNRARALRDAFLTEASDEELERVFTVWSRPEVTKIINESGEIDNPIPLGIRLLKEVPEFRSLATKAASAIIWS